MEYGEPLPHRTLSVCPECKRVIPALVYEKDGKVWIKKECPEHGVMEEIYYEDVEIYEKFRRFAENVNVLESHDVEFSGINCPYDCGLCPLHRSGTALVNVVLTNRCDLSCFYCFFYAKEGGRIYEPTLEQLRFMLKRAREQRPVPAIAVQFTGGEPTLREDLIEIIKMARELGYTHVQLNTNGIRLSREPELVEKVREAGTNTLYLSFDGVSPEINWKNHWEIPFVFEATRKAGGPGIVLVPTLIRGWNDKEIGEILNFALNHIDIVRGVNFQPVSLVGRMPREERKKQRITIPGAIKEIEEQTGGAIGREDFYPVPFVHPISELVQAITGKPQFTMPAHFACGAATYVFLIDDKPVPITRFVDVEGLMEEIRRTAEKIKAGKNKWISLLSLWWKLDSYVDKSRAPRGFSFRKFILSLAIKHDYATLGQFHYKSLFVGFMHFMDEYNYDIERVQRCVIHYVLPDGRLVPFCAFNVFPEVYRDKIQELYSYSWEEWMRLHPDYDMKKEKYVRTEEMKKKMEASEAYRKVYKEVRRFW